MPYYLPIAGGRIIGFIPFPRVLVLCEMKSVLSRIWTRVAVSISYDDNHYTTSTSKMRNGNKSYIFVVIGDSNSLSTVAHAFSRRILISLSTDETLLPRYENLFSNFREPSFWVKISPSLKHVYSILSAFTLKLMLLAACTKVNFFKTVNI